MKYGIFAVLGLLLMLTTGAWAAKLGETNVVLDGRNVASAESNYGNFIADALRHAANADIAIIHAMAFPANAQIDKGIVDEQAIRNNLRIPASNITTLKLTPALLKVIMQRALAKFPEPNMSFLQVSGMVVTFDSSKPAATRIVEISMNGKPVDFFDDKTTYTVAMPAELAKGAVGYFADFNKVKDTLVTLENTTVLDGIAKEFTRAGGAITPQVDGRLKDVAKAK